MLGFLGFLILRASTPQMAPLYTGLSFEDSSAIVAELQKQNVPNELRGDADLIAAAAAVGPVVIETRPIARGADQDVRQGLGTHRHRPVISHRSC